MMNTIAWPDPPRSSTFSISSHARLDLVGERLDEVGADERVDGVGAAGLVGDDLLGAQRELGGALRGQRQRLVEAVGVQRLRAAQTAAKPCGATRTT